MSWKFKQIKPQKARGKFLESMWTDPAWSAENKYDGDRRIAQFCGTGATAQVRFTGTRESVSGGGFVEKTINLPHLYDMPDLDRIQKLDGTVLDGEIVAPFAKDLPGGESKYVTAIMGSLPERAIELQKKHGWLEYMVFDCLWFRGADLRGHNLAWRRESAHKAVALWGNKYAKIVSSFSTSTKRRMWEQAKEGLVFKHEDHLYGNEKLWAKLKKEATADVVVTGFEPGKGKYKGQVGAIVFGQYVRTHQSKPSGVVESYLDLLKVGTCSGFDDALRLQMGMKPHCYKGRVLRIRHNGREPTGAFRHPRFDSWRDDKSAKDCVYDPEET